MRLSRTFLNALRSAVTAPPVVGAAYVLGLAGFTWQRGEQGPAASADLASSKLAIALCAIGTGLLLGLVAELLLFARKPPPRLARRSAAGALVEAALLVSAIHALLVLWGMAAIPQLYAARWYAKGGLPRTVQIIATDVLGPRGVVLLALALAIVFARPSRLLYLARRVTGWGRTRLRRRLAAAGVTLVTIGAVAAFAHAPSPIAEAHAQEHPHLAAGPRMNVLVVVADSLRADRIEPRFAPALSAFAERGTKLECAYVSLPSTSPSLVTVLTGLHAHHHGVRSALSPKSDVRATAAAAVPERFARAGYVTGIVGDRGGDLFGHVGLGLSRVDVPEVDLEESGISRQTPLLPVLQTRFGRRLFPVMQRVPEARDPMLLAGDVGIALRAMKGKPFFLAALFSSARAPYASPAPYYAKFADASYRGRFKYYVPASDLSAGEPNADDIRQIRALYDGAVSALDEAFARVLRTLDELGVANETIVVVTADHGETLFDHGHGHGHGDHLFGDEATHVPLLVYDPRIAPRPGGGRRERRIVRDVDIAPTLYELAGVEPPATLDGTSFGAALRGEAIDERHAFAESDVWLRDDIAGLPTEMRIPYVLDEEMTPIALVAKHRMVRDERYKLVYVPTRASVRYMLFDTQLDPGETTDVAAARPEVVSRLRAELWRWMLEDPLAEQKNGWLVPRPNAREGR